MLKFEVIPDYDNDVYCWNILVFTDKKWEVVGSGKSVSFMNAFMDAQNYYGVNIMGTPVCPYSQK